MNKHSKYDLLIPKMIDAVKLFRGKRNMDSIAKLYIQWDYLLELPNLTGVWGVKRENMGALSLNGMLVKLSVIYITFHSVYCVCYNTGSD